MPFVLLITLKYTSNAIIKLCQDVWIDIYLLWHRKTIATQTPKKNHKCSQDLNQQRTEKHYEKNIISTE